MELSGWHWVCGNSLSIQMSADGMITRWEREAWPEFPGPSVNECKQRWSFLWNSLKPVEGSLVGGLENQIPLPQRMWLSILTLWGIRRHIKVSNKRFYFWIRVSHSPGCPQTHYATKDSLELLIFPPPLPQVDTAGVHHHHIWIMKCHS